MLARYYSNQVGRFLSTDPVVKRRKNSRFPQRWNRYAYSLNNPIKFVDPDGLDIVLADSNARAWAMHGYMMSARFRTEFNLAKNNPNVQLTLKSGGEQGSDVDAKGKPKVTSGLTTFKGDGTVVREFKVEGTQTIETVGGPKQGAITMGHEIAEYNYIATHGKDPDGQETVADQAEDEMKADMDEKHTQDDVSEADAEEALKGTEPKKRG